MVFWIVALVVGTLVLLVVLIVTAIAQHRLATTERAFQVLEEKVKSIEKRAELLQEKIELALISSAKQKE